MLDVIKNVFFNLVKMSGVQLDWTNETFNEMTEKASMDLFHLYINVGEDYDPEKSMMDNYKVSTFKADRALAPFRKDWTTDLPLIAVDNVFTFPEDCYRPNVIYHKTDGIERNIEFMSSQEYANELRGYSGKPTLMYPAALYIEDLEFEVYPYTIQRVYLSYFTKPTSVNYVTTVENNVTVYDSENSTYPEWNLEEWYKLLTFLFKDLGANVSKEEFNKEYNHESARN